MLKSSIPTGRVAKRVLGPHQSFPERRRTIRTYGLRSLYSQSDFLAMRHFAAFDGVRAIAALMVVFFHFGGSRSVSTNGWLGVHLFFVLSGFLITTLLLREERVTGRVSLVDFWIRRVVRIAPAYYVALGLTVLVLVTNKQWQLLSGPKAIWYFVSFNPEYSTPLTMSFTQAWTIGIEQKFYLLWPVIAFLVVGPVLARRMAVWAVAMGTLVVLAVTWSSLCVHYSVILMGCGLALLMDSPQGFALVRPLTTRVGALAALAALAVVQLHADELNVRYPSQVPTILLYGLCATLVLPGLCAGTPTARVLACAPLRWLGQRSYSIYLVQVLAGILVTVMFAMPDLDYTKTVMVVVVSALMADLIFRYVERPAIELAKVITRRRRKAVEVRGPVAQLAGAFDEVIPDVPTVPAPRVPAQAPSLTSPRGGPPR